MSASRVAAERRAATSAERAGDASGPTASLRRGLRAFTDALRAAGERLRPARGSGAARGEPTWVQRAARRLSELVEPRLLRQGLAAYARGNPEAAFALLREVSEARPEHARSALAFWEVAVACGRASEAVGAMQSLVHREVTRGRRETAAEHWMALVEAVPDAGIDAGDAVRLLPVLKQRLRGARQGDARDRLREQLRRALRDALDPQRGELTPGLALRLLEEARTLDVGLARSAAERVLASPDLHAAKRARVESLLATLDAEAAAPAPSAVEVLDVAPLEFEAQALLLLEIEREQRTRVDYRAVEAVGVARVHGMAEAPVTLVDLVMRPLRRAGRRRVLRMRADAFEAQALVGRSQDGGRSADPAEEALRRFLAELLERTRAVPLPDPDAALGLQPHDYAGVGAWERELLGRLEG